MYTITITPDSNSNPSPNTNLTVHSEESIEMMAKQSEIKERNETYKKEKLKRRLGLFCICQ
jgi:hypothetical protein